MCWPLVIEALSGPNPVAVDVRKFASKFESPATLQPAEGEPRVGLQADRALFVVESSCFRNYLWLQGALAHNFVMVARSPSP